MLDIILLALIAFCAIKHYRGGITGIVFGIGKFVASVIAAVLFGGLVGKALADGVVGQAVSYGSYYRVKDYVEGRKLSSFFSEPPEGFVKFSKLIGLDVDSLAEKFADKATTDETLREMGEVIARPITETVSGILGYIAVFLIVFIALTIIVFCLKKIKIPVLTSFDKWLGLGLGMILGFFGASLLATVFYTALEVATALTGDANIMNYYNNSILFKFIYDIRIFEFVRNLL